MTESGIAAAGKQQTPIQLPELLILIGRHLSQDDLTSCVRVCHAWHNAMEPLLWTTVNSCADMTAVVNNIHRVQSIDIDDTSFTILVNPLLLLHNQLVHLSVNQLSWEVQQILIHNSDSLQSFTCRIINHHGRPDNIFLAIWNALANISHLSVLHLKMPCIQPAHYQSFSEICERLTSLTLDSGLILCRLRSPTKQPLLKMRRLELIRNHASSRDQLQFIEQCPNLEHLTWSLIQDIPAQPFIFHLSTLPLDRPCRIVSLDLVGANVMDSDFASILNCLSNVKRVIATESAFGEQSCERVIVSTAGSLEELDLRKCLFVSSPMIHAILMACKNLKRFWADDLSVQDMIKPRNPKDRWPQWKYISYTVPLDPRLDDSIVATYTDDWQWSCTGLEELELTFKELGHHLDNSVDVVYDQLAALIRLKRLAISWRSEDEKRTIFIPSSQPRRRLDFLVGNGLERLSTLTSLRELDIRGIDQLRMTVKEAEWMVEHWKSLRIIRGKMTVDMNEEAMIWRMLCASIKMT
ncbi:hypothetical protein BG011_005882 [Mortierella polycephala]|uniref:F-box domain-containing protein n=1 Tax=Mortierella polycephala TaxID=41804 RepID=A0A9P6U0B5_9FUNG|nr:hypothetical protein BG011_005882 [Mortierella polycephala]